MKDMVRQIARILVGGSKHRSTGVPYGRCAHRIYNLRLTSVGALLHRNLVTISLSVRKLNFPNFEQILLTYHR